MSMNWKLRKTFLIFISLILVLMIVLSACTTSNESDSQDEPSTESQESTDSAEQDGQSNESQAAIEEAEAEKKAAEEEAKAAKEAAEQATADKEAAEKALAEAKTAEEKAAAELVLAQAVAMEIAKKEAEAAALAAKEAAELAAKEQERIAAENKAKAELTKPIKLKVSMEQVGDIPAKGNEIESLIKKYTNVELDIQWIPGSALNDRNNIMIASGDMPQAMFVVDTPTINSAMASGVFWEVGPYLKDFPNLMAMDSNIYENIKVNNKIYAKPNYRNVARAAYIYRTDWFKQLGLKLPSTLDELYNVAKTIKASNPGKNGTIALPLFKTYNSGNTTSMNMLRRLTVSQGAPNGWEIRSNGTFSPDFTTPEFKQTLDTLRKMYAEDLINKDFAVVDENSARNLLYSEKAAMFISVSVNAKNFRNSLIKVNPNAGLDTDWIPGPLGTRIGADSGNGGLWVFPKSSVKTEAELIRILNFFNQMMEPEMATLMMRGVEGKHYEKVGTDLTKYINLDLYNKDVKAYGDGIFRLEGYNVLPLQDHPIIQKGIDLETKGAKYAVTNPAYRLTSQTYLTRGAELDKLIQDAQTKYIMGQIDAAGWQDAIDKWYASGGRNVASEYEAAHKAKK